MARNGQAGWFRVHDAFLSDSKLGSLVQSGHHDAVVLYFAVIAHCHTHDTDGVLDYRDRQVVTHMSCTESDAFEELIASGLLTARVARRSGRTTWEVNAYTKWQTTSEQRQDHARIMRELRERTGPKPITSASRDGSVIDREERLERERKKSLSYVSDTNVNTARDPLGGEREIDRTITSLSGRLRAPGDGP